MTVVMTSNDTVRLTYAELAQALGVSLGAARRMVHRHRWPKQVGNDGLSRISVPVEFTARSESVDTDVTDVVPDDVLPDSTPDVSTDVPNDAPPGPAEMRVVAIDEALAAFAEVTRDVARDVAKDVTKDVITTLQEAIATLRVELYSERDRADHAERQVQELRMELAARRAWWPWRRRKRT